MCSQGLGHLVRPQLIQLASLQPIIEARALGRDTCARSQCLLSGLAPNSCHGTIVSWITRTSRCAAVLLVWPELAPRVWQHSFVQSPSSNYCKLSHGASRSSVCMHRTSCRWCRHSTSVYPQGARLRASPVGQIVAPRQMKRATSAIEACITFCSNCFHGKCLIAGSVLNVLSPLMARKVVQPVCASQSWQRRLVCCLARIR
jgi:hypothetical protein